MAKDKTEKKKDKQGKGVDNTARRTWDREEAEERAAAREAEVSTFRCVHAPDRLWSDGQSRSWLHLSLTSARCVVSLILSRPAKLLTLLIQADDHEEESALDAKRRRRFGTQPCRGARAAPALHPSLAAAVTTLP